MHRFFLPPEQTEARCLELSERDAHHARDVLRLKKGDPVVVLNGAGEEFQCTVAEAGRKTFTLNVAQKKSFARLPYQLALLQAIPKGKTMDTIIQKATELGVARIVPLLSERSEVHVSEGDAAGKQERWRTVAIEAIKQCGSPWLPRLELPLTPAAFLERQERFEMTFVASLAPGAQHPRCFFEDDQAEHRPAPGSVGVWVGPEGDFSPVELDAITRAGGLPISLGPQVLRSDTAAIYCLAVLQYECAWRWPRL